jgi:hypothetical protein
MSINYSIPKKYRNQKQKNVFAFSGFRGLDKENKPLKVQPFRATDGHNFIIDSDTLKTRPSYKMEVQPSFVFENGDYIIDWYIYGNTRVYVTRYHFYFETNGVAFNEQAAESNTYRKGGIPTSFDFQGMKPHFQEEKSALFIFCLNNIYVLAKINNLFVFYELRSKPNNPYDVTNKEDYETFNNLPIPYEPTIWLDDKPFDDVNLLSPVSKYRLFAASQNTHNGETIYKLPTVYDFDKHGVFNLKGPNPNISVEFYKGKYGIPTVLPFFIGIEKDNYPVGSLSTYGGPLTVGDPVFSEIRDVYLPPQEFTYFGTTNNTQSTISERYGLIRDNFFTMAVKNTKSVNVFQYLMDYIANNATLFNDTNYTSNKYVKFQMKVRYNATFYENNSSNIVEKAILEKNVFVYVQLKKFDVGVQQLNSQTYTANIADYTASSTTYPTVPTSTTTNHTFYFNEIPDLTNPPTNLNSSPTPLAPDLSLSGVRAAIEDRVMALLSSKSSVITNAQTIKIFGKFYQQYTSQTSSTLVALPSTLTNNFKWNINQGETSPSDPDFYPSEYPVILNTSAATATLNLGFVGTGSQINFSSSSTERTALTNAIRNHVISLALSAGEYVLVYQAFGFKTATLADPEGNLVTFYTTFKTRVEIKATITVADVAMEKRYHVLITGTAQVGNIPITQDLWHFELKELDNEIQFTLKDLFFDFNNEPTIDIKTIFTQNKDYDIIAQSKFGITFGSENRLFLAGNTTYPNIDRFNVSNDLLGDGIDNQSYELTYFPSKNYRVLGGKGAINGYVVATDTELYITKTEYPNDDRLFIRQRTLDNNGVVGYNEFKTNIKKTPINTRCIVRFYNDILILAKDGLYGIEISSNVLTNERLVKLRSAFINEELKKKINAVQDLSKIFMVENDRLMYIFIGQEAYVSDSRYINQNPNSEIENLSYEMVKWTSEVEWFSAKVFENKFYFIQQNGRVIYSLGNENFDEYVSPLQNAITVSDLPNFTDTKVFQLSNAYDYIFETVAKASNYAFVFSSGYKVVGVNPTDFTETSGTVTVLDVNAFAPFTDGDTLYWKQNNANTFYSFTIAGFEASARTTFTHTQASGERVRIYQNIANIKLYITHFWLYQGDYYFRLSPIRPTQAVKFTQNQGELDVDYLTRIKALFNENEDYYFTSVGAQNCLFEHVPYINTRWVSAITDFGNNLFEKTSFRVNIYATKQESSNNMTMGYRTLRRLAGLSAPVDLSNEFNLQDIDYSQFSLATMDTVGFSLPMKENNFLYIQFTINGTGKIELNAIEITYKLNRMLKSVG